MKLTNRNYQDLAGLTNTVGGFTVDTATGRTPVNTFSVGTSREESSHPMPETGISLKQFATKNEAALDRPNRALGGWEHEGKAYQDVPREYPTTSTGETAARFGSLRENQKAYGVLGEEDEGYLGDVNNPFHPEWSGDITPGNPAADAHVWAMMPKYTGVTSLPGLRRKNELGIQ
jgi:hypothetical protein